MKNKLILMKGLMGAGKSTKAKELFLKNKNIVKVSRDDLRHSLFNSVCLDKREKFIDEICNKILEQAFKDRKDIIIDGLNLNSTYFDFYKNLAVEKNYDFEVIDLTSVPLATCISNDEKRTGLSYVGRPIIERASARYNLTNWDTFTEYAIYDMDGTLSDLKDRRNFVRNGNNDWKSFFEKCGEDDVREEVVDMLLNDKYNNNRGIIIVSGRPTDKCWKATDNWLKHFGIPYNHIFMRNFNDSRSDVIVKKEILDLLPKDKIKHVVDDRPKVVQFWKEAFKDTDTIVTDVGTGEDF